MYYCYYYSLCLPLQISEQFLYLELNILRSTTTWLGEKVSLTVAERHKPQKVLGILCCCSCHVSQVSFAWIKGVVLTLLFALCVCFWPNCRQLSVSCLLCLPQFVVLVAIYTNNGNRVEQGAGYLLAPPSVVARCLLIVGWLKPPRKLQLLVLLQPAWVLCATDCLTINVFDWRTPHEKKKFTFNLSQLFAAVPKEVLMKLQFCVGATKPCSRCSVYIKWDPNLLN